MDGHSLGSIECIIYEFILVDNSKKRDSPAGLEEVLIILLYEGDI